MEKCSARTFPDRNVRGYACARPATVERDGKWYCWQHDPVYRKQKSDKCYAEYVAKSEAQGRARDKQRHAASCYPALVAALEKVIAAADQDNGVVRVTSLSDEILQQCREALALAGAE